MLPAFHVVDIADVEFELSSNRQILTMSGERKGLPDIPGTIRSPFPDRHFQTSIDLTAPITLDGLDADLGGGMVTVYARKATSEKKKVGNKASLGDVAGSSGNNVC